MPFLRGHTRSKLHFANVTGQIEIIQLSFRQTASASFLGEHCEARYLLEQAHSMKRNVIKLQKIFAISTFLRFSCKQTPK